VCNGFKTKATLILFGTNEIYFTRVELLLIKGNRCEANMNTFMNGFHLGAMKMKDFYFFKATRL